MYVREFVQVDAAGAVREGILRRGNTREHTGGAVDWKTERPPEMAGVLVL